MANLEKVDPSCLPEMMRKRRELVEQVREVAKQIEFADNKDRSILAKMLDHKGVRPMSAGKWYRKGARNPGAVLTRFLQRHLPELLRSR